PGLFRSDLLPALDPWKLEGSIRRGPGLLAEDGSGHERPFDRRAVRTDHPAANPGAAAAVLRQYQVDPHLPREVLELAAERLVAALVGSEDDRIGFGAVEGDVEGEGAV